MEELSRLDATAQANLVRQRQVTPLELVDAAIARIETLNPRLNAVITPLFDQARAAAAGPLPDGPFQGVPTLLKDLGATLAGVPMASGSAALRAFVPPVDSAIFTKLRAAGFIFAGKTNTPEFGLLPTTEPVAFGPTRNPWDTSRSAGGSSGGSAAAVASGMVPVAHASDGGGSIRIPASACGLFGLKPSRGRVSSAPGGDTVGLSVWNCVSRSVRDSAAFLDVISGNLPGDPYVAPAPARPFHQEVGVASGKLRIAVCTGLPGMAPVHPDCVTAVLGAAALCAELGHEVTEAAPPLSVEALNAAFTVLWASMTAVGIDGLAPLFGRPLGPEGFEPLTLALAEQGRRTNASQYLQALATLQFITRQFAAFFTQYDIWLTPVLNEPPAPLGTFNARPDDPGYGLKRAESYCPFTPFINVSGQPAMSVPLAWNGEGLPIGVHFVGRFGEEATLIRLAAQLEEARPWAHRIPPVHA